MKFAVGYQQREEGEDFVDIVKDYADHIAEVYFPWVGTSSGRAALGSARNLTDWTAQAHLEHDLKRFREMGIGLDLLFNANCYGARSASQSLENEVGSILEHLKDVAGGVNTVTTTSLTVARTVKRYFPEVEVRASVNMRIGTTRAMSHVSGLFDSFYLQRDLQRDLTTVRSVKSWCDAHGKGLCLLANSGCLAFCPGQSFHDNMVAHDREIDEQKNIPDWTPHVCWNLFKNPEEWSALLQGTWIRPEDVHRYEGLVPIMKLATRMHQNPRLVIHAYANRTFPGNLLDLFEPGFGPAFAPHVLMNRLFPEDWFERTSTCRRSCEDCTYCRTVLSQILFKIEE